MPDPSWNPPTGPPNSTPLRPADARREIDQALHDARARDEQLRAELFARAGERASASDEVPIVSDDVAEALSLAKSALTRANESARAGQRADASKWTSAAEVFAMRVRDGRRRVATLEEQVTVAGERMQALERAIDDNVGRLQAFVAARLATLSGRKASKAQQAVDEAVAAISVPTADLVAHASAQARAAAEEEAAADSEVEPVSVDDLESAVDFEGIDEILDELRTELGLPAPAPVATPATGDSASATSSGDPSGKPPSSGRSAGESSSGTPPSTDDAASAGKPPGGGKGKDGSGRSGRRPVARR